jgi:hypothetical protein
MALNPFFLQGSPSEQRLVQDLINEQLKIYGVEVTYIPRKFVRKQTIIEEIQSSKLINRDYRSSNYLSWYINPKPTFSFTAVNYFQPLWQDFKDFRYMGQYTLYFSVIKRLDFRFEINTIYDSNPPVNINNWIMSSNFGVRLKLGE